MAEASGNVICPTIDIDVENITSERSNTSSEQQDNSITVVSSIKRIKETKQKQTKKLCSIVLPSRTSCSNCHQFVSSTSRILRKTKSVSCMKFYPLIRKIEASERKVLAEKFQLIVECNIFELFDVLLL